MIENDNPLTMEYTFRNNIVPVYMKSSELREVLEDYQKELEDVMKKRMELS